MANKSTKRLIVLRRKTLRSGVFELSIQVPHRDYDKGCDGGRPKDLAFVTRNIPNLLYIRPAANRKRKVYPKREGNNE
jgi:hypothetical protein